jgi:hypothetical protein
VQRFICRSGSFQEGSFRASAEIQNEEGKMLRNSRSNPLRSELVSVFYLIFLTCVLAFLASGCGSGASAARPAAAEASIGPADVRTFAPAASMSPPLRCQTPTAPSWRVCR